MPKATKKTSSKTTSDKTQCSDDSVTELLYKEFFIPHKQKGIKEGFRRLALFIATATFIYAFEATRHLSDFAFDYAGTLWWLVSLLAVVLISATVFFVTAAIVKSIGWVIEGFTKK